MTAHMYGTKEHVDGIKVFVYGTKANVHDPKMLREGR